MKILIVVDMQNDFISGSLGTPQAEAIVPKVIKKIQDHQGIVFYTKDTHEKNYMETLEGKNLPIPHCITGTEGHQLDSRIKEVREIFDIRVIEKNTFGSLQLQDEIMKLITRDGKCIDSIELCGLCTGICVISNALILRAAFPNIPIIVDNSCCACVSEQSHKNALEAMKMCQVGVI